MAATVNVESTIASVVVYENRAQVHRVAKTSLPKGLSTVVFPDIPSNVDRSNVQVALRVVGVKEADAPRIALNGITFASPDEDDDSGDKAAISGEPKSDSDKPTSEAQRLRAKIEDLNERIDAAKGQQSQAQQEAELLGTFFSGATATRSNDDPNVYGDVAHWEALMAAKMENDAKAVARGRELQAELKALQTEKAEATDALQKETAEARMSTRNRAEQAPLMKVHLDASAAVAEVEVQASYLMSNASWRATYDLRVNTRDNTATLTYHALVRQSTTETWERVNLTMSTAKPTVSGRAPDLSRWYANVASTMHAARGGGSKAMQVKKSKPMHMSKRAGGHRQRAMQFGGGEQEDEAEELRADDLDDDFSEDDDSDDDDDEGAAEPVTFQQAEVSEGGATTLTFDVPNTHTVPSSNDPVRVSLCSIELKPDITYATRPSAAEVAYAILSATNTSTFAVMPGDANVFVDGQFVTKTNLGRIPPKAPLRIGIGQESGISVKYKTLQTEDSQTGGMLSTKKRRREYRRQVVLKNLKDEATSIKLEHEMPTAEDSRVDVELIEPSPKTAVQEGDGKFVLNVKLGPREEKTIAIVLAVSVPTDLDVTGL